MDFECWESRNLARCVLSEAYRRALYHLSEQKKKKIGPLAGEEADTDEKRRPRRILPARERISRIPGEVQSDDSDIPYYRRFSRGMTSLLSSSEEHLPMLIKETRKQQFIQIRGMRENSSVPFYRRFARSSSLSTPSPGSSATSSSSEACGDSARPSSRTAVLPSSLFRYPETAEQSSIVVWPASGRMNAFLGKAKIEEFIKKNWRFSSKIKYRIDFKCIIRLRGIDRYKYSTLWSNGYFSSRIFFTLDASSENDYIPVTMTYSLPDGKRTHRPTSSESHVLHFLKHLDPMMGKNAAFIKKT